LTALAAFCFELKWQRRNLHGQRQWPEMHSSNKSEILPWRPSALLSRISNWELSGCVARRTMPKSSFSKWFSYHEPSPMGAIGAYLMYTIPY
jgi:hypothetical protein